MNIAFLTLKELSYFDNIKWFFNNIESSYYRNLLAKIAIIIDNYFKEPAINSLVLFLNFNITKKSSIKQNQVNEIFNEIKKHYNNNDTEAFYLKSGDYDIEFEKMQLSLKEGKGIICFTTYATMSSGQNIQYEIPEGFNDYVTLNGYASKYKDFDAIYLHYPTFVIEQVNEDSSIENVISCLFEIEYLNQKKAFKNDTEFKKHIRCAFRKKTYLNANLRCNINIKNSTLIQFIQAIGRICRTNNKNRKILIIADEDVIHHLQESKHILDKRILNKEIISLVNFELNHSKIIRYEEIKKNKDCYAKFYYRYIKNWNWNSDKIAEWMSIRRQLLAFPTLDNVTSEDKYASHYVELAKSEKSLYINFKTGYIINISQEESFLSQMLKCEGFMKYCQDNQIETSWKSRKFIIGNHSFSSIYKAAIGEEFVKFVIEKECKIVLEQLSNSEFELFDYKFGEVYFDFKNWNHRFEKSEDNSIKTIYEKMRRTQAKKIFIINAIKQRNYISTETIDEKIEIIDYIYDPLKDELNKNAILKILKSVK